MAAINVEILVCPGGFDGLTARLALREGFDCLFEYDRSRNSSFEAGIFTRKIQVYITAGVAGLHVEDQVVNKSGGHLGGKEIVDDDTYFQRVSVAVHARDDMRRTTGSDIVIIART
ncbi:hypothetical protein EG328_008245 [Venturia inaequalis]|uniref:methylisocitrate lyase n=1 Tax=Venturia inaequalis TaxID=5025 RepID=A0A8H3VD00_VENIN|nr:hypothetical protein EG328_008245 [Venturia inaequalis]